MAVPLECKGNSGQVSDGRLVAFGGTICHGNRAPSANWTPWPMEMASVVVVATAQPQPP